MLFIANAIYDALKALLLFIMWILVIMPLFGVPTLSYLQMLVIVIFTDLLFDVPGISIQEFEEDKR